MQKLRDYCQNPAHPQGDIRHELFLASLGLGRTDAGVLHNYIATAVRTHEAQPLESDRFADRYIVFVVPETVRKLFLHSCRISIIMELLE